MISANNCRSGGHVMPAPVWKRLGIAGFLFFLIKGLLRLAAPADFYVFA